MKSLLIVLVLALLCSISSLPLTAATTTPASQQVRSLRHQIARTRAATWHYQDLRAPGHRTPTRYKERRTSSVRFLRWDKRLWARRLHQAKRALAAHPSIPHLQLWLCIHSYEAGSWADPDTGHNGHYGGLQMTSPWGTGAYYVYRADWLTPYEQMRKAELGYAASGYSRVWLQGQWDHPDCIARYA